jgi:hypothetical protein
MTLAATRSTLLIAAAMTSAGMVAGGYLLGDGLTRARMADRSVTVRGLAERNVTADLATWTVVFSETGTDLGTAQGSIDEKSRAVRAFFARAGFPASAVSDTGASVNQFFDSNRQQNVVTVRRRLQLRTVDVMRARSAFARQADLIRAGVPLEEGSGIVYSFTKLNAIKPQMIAESTRSARASAEQFADDSGADVSGIKSATQGYFSIGARDGDVEGQGGGGGSDSPLQKVRVVTTIEFYLR